VYDFWAKKEKAIANIKRKHNQNPLFAPLRGASKLGLLGGKTRHYYNKRDSLEGGKVLLFFTAEGKEREEPF